MRWSKSVGILYTDRRGSKHGGGQASMAAGKQAWRRASKHGGGQACMAAGKHAWRQASKHGGGQACMAAGRKVSVKMALSLIRNISQL